MFGTARAATPARQARCYLVVDTDAEVGELHARALAAGGSTVPEPADMDEGGRGSNVADPTETNGASALTREN